MARFSPYSARGRHRRRIRTIYLGAAIVIVALVVYFLLWGDASAPQEVLAGQGNLEAAAAEEPTGATADLASETDPPVASASAVQERSNQALPQVPGRPASTPVETPMEVAVPAQTPPAAPVAVAVEAEANGETELAVAKAMALLSSPPRQVVAARDKLNATLSMPMAPAQRRAVMATMAKLSDEWLFGPSAFAGDALCETYTVKRGDLLEVIGRRHKVPFEILMKINNIPRPESLQAGKAIKVINGPFHAKVSRLSFTLDIYLQDTYVRSFKVGLGKVGSETPTGLWRVQEGGRLIQPPWYDKVTGRTYKATDPDYPLGSRWIALDGISGDAKGRTGFAIHGTKDPDQIGLAGSRGCIRMYNGEAILVYNLLFPLYSKVEVFD